MQEWFTRGVYLAAGFAIGERCVLLPGSERLTVARLPRAVTP